MNVTRTMLNRYLMTKWHQLCYKKNVNRTMTMKTIFQINRTMTILSMMIVTIWWWLIIITSIRLPRLSSILPYTSFLEWYCPEFFIYTSFSIFSFVKSPQTLFENAVSMQIDDYDDEKYHREPPHTGWIGPRPEKKIRS